jgi:hypothetical protein
MQMNGLLKTFTLGVLLTASSMALAGHDNDRDRSGGYSDRHQNQQQRGHHDQKQRGYSDQRRGGHYDKRGGGHHGGKHYKNRYYAQPNYYEGRHRHNDRYCSVRHYQGYVAQYRPPVYIPRPPPVVFYPPRVGFYIEF